MQFYFTLLNIQLSIGYLDFSFALKKHQVHLHNKKKSISISSFEKKEKRNKKERIKSIALYLIKELTLLK